MDIIKSIEEFFGFGDDTTQEKETKKEPKKTVGKKPAKKKAAAKGEVFVPMHQREITAIIAYIQRLGTDIKVKDNAKK